MKYQARSMHQARLPYFQVAGGPFASTQTMGWHITDEKGLTVAVSCDAGFCEWLNTVVDENEALKARLAELESER